MNNKNIKLISWNVNGLRACLSKDALMPFISQENPDVICFQETKMQPDQLSVEFPGYHLFMNSAERKGYSGTLVLSKQEPINVTFDIEGDHPLEGRVITVEYSDYFFVCAYVPNSKDGLLRIEYREYFEDCMRKHLNKLKKKKPVIYTGDLNVAHNEIDLKNPDTNHNNPGFSDQERNKFNELLESGFTDTFRYLYPNTVKYSWWSYRMRAREKGVGWRIDYFIVSDDIKDKIVDSLIYDEVMGSDHCPIGLIINLSK